MLDSVKYLLCSFFMVALPEVRWLSGSGPRSWDRTAGSSLHRQQGKGLDLCRYLYKRPVYLSYVSDMIGIWDAEDILGP